MPKDYSTPVTETQAKHVSIRSFTDKPIPEGMLHTILDASRRAPTSSNMQTYSIVVVQNPEVKKELAELAGGQKHIEVCPVFMAFCADIYRLGIACDLHGVELAKSLETTLVSTVDASLVGMNTQTAAESFGLGAVMIGGMRNHPNKVAELLGLPEGVYVVYGMCLGWPVESDVPSQKPRLPEDLVVHFERYKTEGEREKITKHDEELAEHYESLGRNLADAAWSGPIAKRLQNPARPKLRKVLEGLGFWFD